MTINKFLIIRHSHLLSNPLLSVICVYFAVLSSEPVKTRSGAVVLPEKEDAVTDSPQVKQAGVWKKGLRLSGKCSLGVNGRMPFDFRWP